MGRIDMRASLIFIVIASCNAELSQLKTADLLRTDNHRIIGGSPTTIEQYPFATQVIYLGYFRCGGSLVTTRHVLSAAHCFIGGSGFVDDPNTTSILVGTTFVHSGGSLHSVKAIKVYDQYDIYVNHNDVAVVLMVTPVDLTTSVARLALLPFPDAVVPDYSSVTSIGWGLTNVDNPDSSSNILNEVTLQKINMNTCQARYAKVQNRTGKKYYKIISSMMCAGILDVKKGKGSCQGDSGGPLLYKGIVVGIASWTGACASPEIPTVYVRVANYTSWINDTVNDSQLQFQALDENTDSLSNKVGAITLLTSLLVLGSLLNFAQ